MNVRCVAGIGLVLIAGSTASAQILHTQVGGLSTGPTAQNGTASPAGTTWSECQANLTIGRHQNTAGFGFQQGAGNRIADNFTVPAGQTWTITKINMYGYLTGGTSVTSPYSSLQVRVYGAGGPNTAPIFTGAVNGLTASGWTTVYRIFNTMPGCSPCGSLPATNRPVWRGEAGGLSIGPLAAGTYWVDLTATGPNFSPMHTTPGQLEPYPAGGTGNAMQSVANGVFNPLADANISCTGTCAASGLTSTVDLVFQIEGTSTSSCSGCCCVDFNNDEEFDFSDIEGFLAAYGAQTPGSCKPGADFNGDTEFDFSDIEQFLAQYAGCS